VNGARLVAAIFFLVTDLSFRRKRLKGHQRGEIDWVDLMSELIGLSVRTKGNEEKGKIKDLYVSPEPNVLQNIWKASAGTSL
jgi:hypothetical protein